MPSDDHMMTASQVRAFLGGLSDMCLWRWLRDPELGFPQPIYLRRRRYWKANEIRAFAHRQERSAKAA
jgi:predicted DNA-binding transcriptional regulator AlpA